jgi:hypothetical protein
MGNKSWFDWSKNLLLVCYESTKQGEPYPSSTGYTSFRYSVGKFDDTKEVISISKDREYIGQTKRTKGQTMIY